MMKPGCPPTTPLLPIEMIGISARPNSAGTPARSSFAGVRVYRSVGIERLHAPGGADLAVDKSRRHGGAIHQPDPDIAGVVGPQHIGLAVTVVIARLGDR